MTLTDVQHRGNVGDYRGLATLTQVFKCFDVPTRTTESPIYEAGFLVKRRKSRCEICRISVSSWMHVQFDKPNRTEPGAVQVLPRYWGRRPWPDEKCTPGAFAHSNVGEMRRVKRKDAGTAPASSKQALFFQQVRTVEAAEVEPASGRDQGGTSACIGLHSLVRMSRRDDVASAACWCGHPAM